MKSKLDNILKKTFSLCIERGALKKTEIPDYVLEVPNNQDHGHFATNLAMASATSQKRPPREIAEILVSTFKENGSDLIDRLEIAGPGFINFKIKKAKWLELLDHIASDEEYGRDKTEKNQKILFEFVSANPTGPLHLGHGRGAALGDTICRILSFRGYDVTREFYVNDAGLQIRLLGESIFSRWKQIDDPEYPFPQGGYHGDYILDLVHEISSKIDLSCLSDEEAISVCAEQGKEKMLDQIREDLKEFRTSFDIWFNETDLFKNNLLEKSLKKIDEKGKIYDKDGAIWIQTSSFGDDKDRVIRKQDGLFTYFASDIAYHFDKYKRGFTKAVNIWGADHHGYVRRVKAALNANDIDDSWLSILLVQLVKLWEGGQEIKMSKRSGQYVTVKELIEDVGVDAVRFVFLTKSHDSQLDFDVDKVKKHDSENPVYYVQYAHARICSIFEKARKAGITLYGKSDIKLDLLVLEEELRLIRLMSEFPQLLEEICKTYEAHRLTYFLTDLASQFHKYFNLGLKIPKYRIVTDDKNLSLARLRLVEGIRNVIKNGLGLLGINAPEKM